jgi:hypothetical protein|tara:strand:+ start:1571 stop:2035 length:465 start_codon:yes stop_codon:yes gene_type:complete
MARFTYGASNIQYQTFNSWSNALDPNVTSNISASVAYSEFDPAQSEDYAASYLQGSSVFFGSVHAGTGGTVSLTAPYTVAATANITVKNLNITNTSLTIVATTSYPWVFDSWRTAGSGGGSQIAGTATVTVSDDSAADHNEYHAHFTTTHLDPP